MTIDIAGSSGVPLTTAERSNSVAESLRQIARAARFVDRKKGIRAYKSHHKTDPWIPILFVTLCLVPNALSIAYLYLIASDRYVTEARFAIRPALGGAEKAAGDDIGTGSTLAKQMVAQDTLIAANYIHSRPMVEAMEKLFPLRTMFSRPEIDWLARFDAEKPIERLVRYWQQRVKVDVENSSGIVSLSVNAFDPAESLALSRAILAESERMVNDLTVRMRDDALSESRRELALAEERMSRLRLAVRDLRNRDGVLDAEKSNETNLKVVAELNKAKVDLVVQLALSQRDLSPASRRVQDLKLQIADLDENIQKIGHDSANDDPERRRVLSDSLSRFEAYDRERKDAESYYAKALGAYEKSRIIAARQIAFFSPVVMPVLAQSAEQPRRLLAISLIAAGWTTLFALAVVTRKYLV